MWFRKDRHEQERINAEFERLVENTEIDTTLGGPRDYTLAENPNDGEFVAPIPDPLPKPTSIKQISIIGLAILVLTLAGLGIAQVVLPVWARLCILATGSFFLILAVWPFTRK